MNAPQFLEDSFGTVAGHIGHQPIRFPFTIVADPVSAMVSAHAAYRAAENAAEPYSLLAVTRSYVQVSEAFFTAHFPNYRESVDEDYITRTAYSDGVLFLALFDRVAS